MANNSVAILGESGTFSARMDTVGAAPVAEFRSGSFRGSVDERRVVGMFVFVPTGSKELEIRFEFTDVRWANQDLHGNPRLVADPSAVPPFKEPKQARSETEGR